jgi:hypothetical protein
MVRINRKIIDIKNIFRKFKGKDEMINAFPFLYFIVPPFFSFALITLGIEKLTRIFFNTSNNIAITNKQTTLAYISVIFTYATGIFSAYTTFKNSSFHSPSLIVNLKKLKLIFNLEIVASFSFFVKLKGRTIDCFIVFPFLQ